jgi:hypothetical protein
MTSTIVVANPVLPTVLRPTPADATHDAFGRLRVSDPNVLFDSKQVYDSQPLLWSEKTVGSATATYRANEASTRLTVTTSASDRVVRQTRQAFNYEPGRSQLAFITFNAKSAVANVEKAVGYYNDDNGLAFVLDGLTPKFRVRSYVSGSAVDTDVEQSNWNLDAMDGTGPSSIDLDWSLNQILVIDFEWLGLGSARLGFVVGGSIVYAHQFNHANILSTVYMSTPNLPVRYEVQNSAASAGASLDAICATVMAEGGERGNGQTFAVDRGVSGLDPSGSDTVGLVALRLKTDRLGPVRPIDLSVMAPAAADFRWCLLVNPTRGAGTAPSWTSVSDSQIEFDITSTEVLTGGTQIASGYAATGLSTASRQINPFYALGTDVDGVADELVLAVQQVDGNAGDTYVGSITFLEQ